MEYIEVVEIRWATRNVCQAVSMEYLELCDKYSIGWVRRYKPPAGRKTRLRAWQLLMRSVKSAFTLLLAKVTKHIPPQTSPAGSSLAGIWSAVSRHFCKTLYYNLYNKARRNYLLVEVMRFEYGVCNTVCVTKDDVVSQYVRQQENKKIICVVK